MHLRRALSATVLTGTLAVLGTVLAVAVPNSSAPTPASGMVSSTEPATTRFTAAVAGLTATDRGHVSVAVENLGTGVTTSYNVGDDYVTASIVKLDILCTLLYQDQLSGDTPDGAELSEMTSMIENSDNDAAQSLFEQEGGAAAITAANRVFGLSDTVMQRNTRDEAGYSWGDTTTSVLDQLRLLRQVFTPGSVLTAANRTFIEGLMANVESDQRWGVSAAADDPSPAASDYLLKNGWLPRATTNLWEINSIGEVQHGGQRYLVAVLSSDNQTMASGIAVVQQVAKAAVDARI
jgi:beta-lactamase class A